MDQKQRFQISKALMGNQNAKRKTVNSATPATVAETSSTGAPAIADISEHCPMPINAAGQGPELDKSRVVRTICWSCRPEQDWPCAASTEDLDLYEEAWD